MDVESPEREHPERYAPAPDRPAIHPAVGPHQFVESEFPEGAGHCDVCGGGPLAEIHNPVDQMARIAEALERVADALERPYRLGAFWRMVDWFKHFFGRAGM